jgi:hypothetical protein
MTRTETDLRSHRMLMTVLIGTGAALGVTVGVFTGDVIAGVIAAVAFIAVATQMVKLWVGHPGPPAAPR